MKYSVDIVRCYESRETVVIEAETAKDAELIGEDFEGNPEEESLELLSTVAMADKYEGDE